MIYIIKIQKIRRIAAVVLSLTVLYLSAGCSSGTGENTEKNGLFEIKVQKAAFADLLFVADDLGFFKKHGLQVRYISNVPASNVYTAVATGEIDFASSHVSKIIGAVASGIKIKAVCSGAASVPERPVAAIVVRADSGIRNVSDLAGKKAALAPHFYPWLMAFEKAGISESQVQLVTLELDKMEAALLQGDIDAFEMLDPYLTKVVNNGTGRILLKQTDVAGIEAGWPQRYTSLDFIEKHPEQVKAFVTAMAEAYRYSVEHPDEMPGIYARYLGTDPTDTELYNRVFAVDQVIDEKNARFWLDAAVHFGDIREGQLDIEDIYTNAFNPYAAKQ